MIDFESAIVSPRDVLTAFKTDPITSPGFFPASFAHNLTELREGQNITAVAYRANVVQNHTHSEDDLWSTTYPGGAAEFPLQVSAPQYCAKSPYYLDFDPATELCGAILADGPCTGKIQARGNGSQLA